MRGPVACTGTFRSAVRPEDLLASALAGIARGTDDGAVAQLRWAHRRALEQVSGGSAETRRAAWARLLIEEARTRDLLAPGTLRSVHSALIDMLPPLPRRTWADLDLLLGAYRADSFLHCGLTAEALRLVSSLDGRRAGDPEIEATVYESTAACLQASGRAQEARRLLQAALAALACDRERHAERRIETLIRLGTLELALGDDARGLHLLGRAERALRPATRERLRMRVGHELAIAEAVCGRLRAALARFERLDELYERTAPSHVIARRRWVEGTALHALDRLGEAAERLDEALDRALRGQLPPTTALAILNERGQVARRAGKEAEHMALLAPFSELLQDPSCRREVAEAIERVVAREKERGVETHGLEESLAALVATLPKRIGELSDVDVADLGPAS